MDARVALASGTVVRVRAGRLHFCDPPVQAWCVRASRDLIDLDQVDAAKTFFTREDATWELAMDRVPVEDFSSVELFPPHDMLLVLLKDVTRRCSDAHTLQILLHRHGLTAAEIRLCHTLVTDLSLNEAAAHLHITRETARQRLKAVFAKTGIRRQADLLSLFARLV
ncbi:hypothetical protein MRS76_25630 [Rhizobiaceae bacterium n13]|uniref:HTH luxR-type domain-containing protein n=1 Tax=Ferirhizobium litorale TaxID=2927786 RepID=A0AAE3U668_9HYPH|nr:hypothetical protein [Fererhizobium litorale]MDI7865280.1 hypothetical protein [Fererhizobium litorale]MDI7925183.1 hypothetical protein [Fererhizobium litorale]